MGANFNPSLKEVLGLTVPAALGEGERTFLTQAEHEQRLRQREVQVYLGNILGAERDWNIRSMGLVEFTTDYEVVRP